MVMSRRLWILGVFLVLAATASGAWFYAQSRGSTPRFRAAKVERGPLTATVSATGTLNAVVTVQVGSQVSGQIKELFADFNSQVKRNQLVARIDPEKFQAAVSQAKAQVDAAKATVLNQRALVEKTRADLANAQAALAVAKAQTAKAQVAVVDTRRTLPRNADLRKRGLIAQADEDTAQAAYDSAVAQAESAKAQEGAQASQIRSAEAQLKVTEAMLQAAIANVVQQEASLKQAQVDLDPTEIRAPEDRVVVSRTAHVGQAANVRLVVDEKDSVLKVPNSALRFRLPGDDSVPVRGVAPGAGAGGGAGQPSIDQIRERLTKSLGLTAEQQQKLEPILQDTREKIRALGARGANDNERRIESQRIREASREQIRGILTPEQRTRYDQD